MINAVISTKDSIFDVIDGSIHPAENEKLGSFRM